MNLNKSVDNLNTCMMSKVAVEQKIKAPTIDILFEVKKVESSSKATLILAAINRDTGTYLYLAESDPVDGRWKANNSEFRDRIYLFVNQVMEEIQYEDKIDSLSIMEQGKVLERVATRIYKKFSE